MRISFFSVLSLLTLFSSVLFVVPATPTDAGIIPCGLSQSDPAIADGGTAKCTPCHLIVGINNVIILLRDIMTAVAMVVIVAMAFVYITAAGNEERMHFAKRGITAALIGFAVILLAWIIVNFIMTMPIFSNTGLVRANWDSVTCNTTSVAQ